MNLSWNTKKIKELYDYSSGLSKSADQFGFGYPFLSYKDVFHNAYLPETLSTLVNSTEIEQEKCSIKRGDVFLTRTSETTDELGMSSVALVDYPYATYNGFTKRLRPTTNEIHPEFAAYFYRSPYFRAQIISMASLITRASLNESNLDRLKITYPNKETQIVIGNILQSYDLIINSNVKKIRLLEKMASELYKEWFVRFRFPGHETTKFVDGVPEGWEMRKLSEMVEFDPFIRLKKGLEYRSVPMDFLSTDSMLIDTSRCDYTTTTGGAHFQNGDTLLARITPCLENGKTGFVNTLDDGETAVGSTEFIVMRSKLLSPHLVYFIARSEYFRKTAINSMNGADGRQRAKISKLQSLSYPLPTRDIIDEFSEIVEPFFEEIKNLNIQNHNLTKQRDLLLPRLMSGKLSVEPLLGQTA